MAVRLGCALALWLVPAPGHAQAPEAAPLASIAEPDQIPIAPIAPAPNTNHHRERAA